MKATITVIGLGLLVAGCINGTGAVPAAEIQSMSDNQIAVVYHDSISGMGDATRIARSHCDPQSVVPAGSADAGSMPDKTVVTFNCK